MPERANPKLRAIQVQPAVHQGQQGVVLADPLGITEAGLFVPAALAPILPLIDGTRDLGTLRTGFELRTGIPLSPGAVQRLISELDASMFLDNANFADALEAATREYRQAKSRTPVMAGRSCPGDPQELAAMLQGYLDAAGETPGPPAEIKGLISPHIDFPRGGPVYGGAWAAAAPAVKSADLIVILGTDHNGGEGEITVTRQSYETPWGIVPTDQEAVDRIAVLAGEDTVFKGELRHRGEHSVEAALIWAHYLRREKPPHVLPILCGSFESFIRQGVSPSAAGAIPAIVEALRETVNRRRTIVVAAADLAHVGPVFGDLQPLDLATRARLEAQDRRLLDVLQQADPEAFLAEIKADGDQRRICGIPPIYILLAVLTGTKGSVTGYAQCPASPDGGSIVSICGMVYH
ncbi:MAG: AmmeMemoRadiSam system protein B [Dehalococcoidia bacterium]|nr:AmmeMemoRadiSam system protein B [Dehalococcoidia bacterium]